VATLLAPGTLSVKVASVREPSGSRCGKLGSP
jgi:hypothetical protein